MADEFDLAAAEAVHMAAVNALGPGRSAERLYQFAGLTECLGRSLNEIKRLRVGRVAMVAEALNELNALMLTQLDDAINRRGSLVEAVREFRERNYYLTRHEDGQWRWAPRPESDIHAAVEKLTAAMLDAEGTS